LALMVPFVMSMDADVVSAITRKFVASMFHEMEKKFTWSEQLMFMGCYASQPQTARIHSLMRTQEQDRWKREIHTKNVLIIQGRYDRHAETDRFIEVAKRYIRSFELKIAEDSGHSPSLEQPEEVNGWIFNFLQRKVAAHM